MTKLELLQCLEPFMDETEVRILYLRQGELVLEGMIYKPAVGDKAAYVQFVAGSPTLGKSGG